MILVSNTWPLCARHFSTVAFPRSEIRIRTRAPDFTKARRRRAFPLHVSHFKLQLLAVKYRRFGRTELQMPVISCGGMRYQYKWQDVAPAEVPADNQRNLEAPIHRAVELGINHIETARGYGSSEMQLGSVLPSLPREKIIVQTKVGPKESTKEFLKTFETQPQYLRPT